MSTLSNSHHRKAALCAVAIAAALHLPSLSASADTTATPAAHAKNADPAEAVVSHVKVIERKGHTRFLADGSMVQEQTEVAQALTPQGAQALVKLSFLVNNRLENFVLVQAATRKADDRSIAVDDSHITRQRGSITPGSGISWQDVDVVQINFPDLQVGDQISYTTRKTTTQAALAGWLTEFALVEPTVPIDRFSWTIEAPKSLRLQVQAPLMKLERSETDDQQRWVAAYGPSAAIAPEPNMANAEPWVPLLMASTHANLEQTGDAFSRVMRDKQQITPQIRQLAQEITQGLTDDRAKARAIFDWVRQKIRYVAVFLGAGGWVPHDIETILANRFGDCKDHTLLLHTLLAAVNIDAAPALIFTGASNQLPPVAIPRFNHVITYLPGLKQFVDSTASDIPFDALPEMDSDKPVLVGLSGGTQRMRTPAFSAQGNRLETNTQWTIRADGSAEVNMRAQASGQAAFVMQNRLQEIPPLANSIAVSKLLSAAGWQGRGFLRYDPIQRAHQTQGFSSEAEIRNLLPDATAGQVNPSLQLTQDALSVARLMGNFEASKRRFGLPCTPVSARENFQFTFAPEFQLLKLPKDFERTVEGRFHFKAHYERKGNTISGWREFARVHDSHYCSAEDYARESPTYREIAQHLRTAILYTQ